MEPNFNSHARVGRDRNVFSHPAGFSYFNSHARVGRDTVAYKIIDYLEVISTHTPV